MTGLSLRHTTPAFRTFAGKDALAGLPRELARLDVSRAVVFCGASMSRHPDALDRVETALGTAFVGRFDGVREHSPVPDVLAARRFLADTGADAVIALGGGSAVVTARAATILLAEDAEVRELCTRRGPDGRLTSPRLSAPKLPQWVVPSTPSTAYAKAGSAVRDPETGERLPVVAEALGTRAGDPIAAIEELLTTLAVPARLRDVGVDRDALPEIVDHALDDWFITQVPRPADRDELTALVEAAW